jgi:hypothetical protein
MSRFFPSGKGVSFPVHPALAQTDANASKFFTEGNKENKAQPVGKNVSSLSAFVLLVAFCRL